jgi:hypothetical protein
MSTINLVAHGLVAGQRVVISNITPAVGTGVDPDFVYFVLAAGLTANAFQISETDAGTPITILLPITAASLLVVPETTDTDTFNPTYVQITDPTDAQAPPPTITTPLDPVLSSDTATGVVRLLVALSVAATEATVRQWQVQITDKYSGTAPSGPDWSRPEEALVPLSLASYNIRAHPLTWYSVRCRYVDTFGNYSAFSNVVDLQTVAGYDAVNAVASAVSSLLDHKIGTVEIENGAVTADILAGTIILGSTIIAGTPPAQHVEMDRDGIRLVDASSNVVVNVPTDALQPVSVTGDIQAGHLTAVTSSELRGPTSLPTGAVVTAQGSIAAPTAAPVLVSGYETIASGTSSGFDWGGAYNGTHLCIVSNPDAGLATAVNPVLIYKYTTAGVLAATITTNLVTKLFTNGIAWDGTNFYIATSDATQTKVVRLNSAGVVQATTTITADISGNKGQVGMFYDSTDGFLIVITTTGTGAGVQYRFRRYNVPGVTLNSTRDASGTNTHHGANTSITGGARVGTDYWVGTFGTDANDGLINAFTAASPAPFIANSSWGYTSAGAAQNSFGIMYDGTNFYWRASTTIYKATNWTMTGATSAKHWVSYAWYDSVGTTHETAVGPRASITIYNRMRLSVTNASIPTGGGGVDDPNHARIYMLQNATDTGAGTYWVQLDDANTQRYLTTYLSALPHDGAGAAFGGGTSAELKSSTTGWSLKGDGTGTLGTLVTGGKPPIVRTYTVTGANTWTKPSGLASIVVECIGGGGAGGGAAATAAGQAAVAGGGGGGAYARKIFTAADLVSAVTCTATVGTGGVAGAAGANNGGAGVASTFAGTGITTVSAGGGGGGTGAAASTSASGKAGGAGGTATGGDQNIVGEEGQWGWAATGPLAAGPGWGGNSGLGWGSPGRPNFNFGAAAATAGAGFGAGGGGIFAQTSSPNAAGGAGAPGLIIVTEHYVG